MGEVGEGGLVLGGGGGGLVPTITIYKSGLQIKYVKIKKHFYNIIETQCYLALMC